MIWISVGIAVVIVFGFAIVMRGEDVWDPIKVDLEAERALRKRQLEIDKSWVELVRTLRK